MNNQGPTRTLFAGFLAGVLLVFGIAWLGVQERLSGESSRYAWIVVPLFVGAVVGTLAGMFLWHMKRTNVISALVALSCALLHFLLLGIPFITNEGGEGAGLVIVIANLPLFVLVQTVFPSWPTMLNWGFDFFVFVILGATMYAGIGFLLARVLLFVWSRVRRQ